MNIEKMYLNSTNTANVNGKTLGERITAIGKDRLWNDRKTTAVDTVVIHYASAGEFYPETPLDLLPILCIFCDLGVSSHYIIMRNGQIYALVPEDKRAWHCGGSIMPEPDNRLDVNDFSLGIELVATSTSGFSNEQYLSLSELSRDIEKRYQQSMLFVGHEDVAGERAVAMKLRSIPKIDPGILFDWNRFFSGIRQ